MQVLQALHSIRTIWTKKVAARLARGEGVRSSFQEEIDRFYDLLLQAVESGDPAWLESLMDGWVNARPESDLEQETGSVPSVLRELLLLFYETSFEGLPPQEALETLGALLPVITHAITYAAAKESQQHVEHVSQQLETARMSLERLDRSKSDFIAIAAHELKTPLTLIEGYTAMLRDSLRTDDAQSKVLLKGIDNGAHRLREIVDDMIDVSLIDNNLLSLNYQPVWLNRLLDIIQHEFHSIIEERRISFTVRNFPGSDEMNFGDSERLYQAFRNLIVNAIKYTPDGGWIEVNGRKLPGFIEVTIQDSGIGIAPEDHLRIFEKFGRIGSVSLHSSGKTKFKGGGPGLGLPITKGIIEAHGGAIWVESEGYDDERYPGSTFHVLLPIRSEPPDDKMARLFKASLQSDGSEMLRYDPSHGSEINH